MRLKLKIVWLILLVLSATYSQAQRKKPVVGIAGIATAAQNISCRGWDAYTGRNCNRDLADGFRIMLETAIVKSGKMDVMERNQLNAVLQEQGIGQAGLTTGGGQIGGLTGVDYLLYGSITKFGARQKGMRLGGESRSSRRRSESLFSSSNLITEMAVDLKVTEVATGRIVLADTVEGEAEQGKVFNIVGFGSGEAKADPFADVQRVVAARLSEAVVTDRIPIKVIQIQQDGTLILNYGNVFFETGNRLTLFEVGEQIIDPDTGEVLGAEATAIGTVQVTSVEPRFSRARALGDFPIAVGSVLKRAVPVKPKKGARKRKRSGGLF